MIVEREPATFAAAEELRFELAARLRDEIADLRRELLQRQAARGSRGRRRDAARVPASPPKRAPGRRRR